MASKYQFLKVFGALEVDFACRKTGALRCRFWLRCLRRLSERLRAQGGRLMVCHGRPEEVLGALPQSSLVFCQSAASPQGV